MGKIIEIAFIIVFIMLFLPFVIIIGIKFLGPYIEWLADKFDI